MTRVALTIAINCCVLRLTANLAQLAEPKIYEFAARHLLIIFVVIIFLLELIVLGETFQFARVFDFDCATFLNERAILVEKVDTLVSVIRNRWILILSIRRGTKLT